MSTDRSHGLLRRWVAVLNDLELISEAPAARPHDSAGGHAALGSAIPAGINSKTGRRMELPLSEKHLNRFEELVIDAEVDRDRVRFRPPSRDGESQAEWGDRVVAQYEGVHYRDVAQRENANFMAVRRARETREREPLTGRPRSQSGKPR